MGNVAPHSAKGLVVESESDASPTLPPATTESSATRSSGGVACEAKAGGSPHRRQAHSRKGRLRPSGFLRKPVSGKRPASWVPRVTGRWERDGEDRNEMGLGLNPKGRNEFGDSPNSPLLHDSWKVSGRLLCVGSRRISHPKPLAENHFRHKSPRKTMGSVVIGEVLGNHRSIH
jgi:hypothetical protein